MIGSSSGMALGIGTGKHFDEFSAKPQMANGGYRYCIRREFMETNSTNPRKVVYSIIEREHDHNIWVKIGAAWINRDGSLNIRLDALPLSDRLQIRDAEESKQ